MYFWHYAMRNEQRFAVESAEQEVDVWPDWFLCVVSRAHSTNSASWASLELGNIGISDIGEKNNILHP